MNFTQHLAKSGEKRRYAAVYLSLLLHDLT
jgi:hypothetical protein